MEFERRKEGVDPVGFRFHRPAFESDTHDVNTTEVTTKVRVVSLKQKKGFRTEGHGIGRMVIPFNVGRVGSHLMSVSTVY